MNRTVDLSFLNRDFELYVQQWNKLGYSAAMNCFLAGNPLDPSLGFVIDTEVLCIVLRNKHKGNIFPLNAVPEQCPFKKRELVEAWDSFISMFSGPPEIADQHLTSGYEE
jgi:hypothetical protein